MRYVTICMVVAGILLIECGTNPSGSSSDSSTMGSIIGRSPMPDSTAEIAAVILSRELVAPAHMYVQIKRDLQRIRAEYGDSLQAVNLPYLPTYHWPGWLSLQASDSVMNDPSSSTRRVLDSLNEKYGLEAMINSVFDYYSLRFHGRLNSARLVEIYAQVPYLKKVFTSGARAGDYSRLLILPDRLGYHYFFRLGSGDCPSGCIYSRIYYFTVEGNRAVFHGECDYSYASDTTQLPGWFGSYRKAWDQMAYKIRWTSDSGYTYYPDKSWFYPTK